MNAFPISNRREFCRSTLAQAGLLALLGEQMGCGYAAEPKASDAKDKLLGEGAYLGDKLVFPKDNPWNQDISKEKVDPASGALLASIGLDKGLHPDFGTTYEGEPLGIPYAVVSKTQEKVKVKFEYDDESDPGPYPIPSDAPIEGGLKAKGDRHIIIVDRDNWKLYELFAANPDGTGWKASAGAIFDLGSNKLRPAGWTSADAAGLPIFPGLARYEEVMDKKEVKHALRFTCRKTRHAYVPPARHFASTKKDEKLPPMGMRVRLKADYDISEFPEPAKVILTALKKYGMFLADNGGDWFVSGSPDSRWNDEDLNTLKRVQGRDFEVVKMGALVTR